MLYLIRHAHAAEADADAERPLSARGRGQVTWLAEMLRNRGGFHPQEIWHSPLLRARQTAQLLAETLSLGLPLKEVPGLRPDDAPALVAARLESVAHSIAIVGHNPHLSFLGSLLVTGAVGPPIFVMRKASILALEPARGPGVGCWLASWQLAPDSSD
jgi:phosphohistidine phosphatase